MKKALLIFLTLNFYFLIPNGTWAQSRRNFIGYMPEASIFRPSVLGISYERQLVNHYSLAIQANGLFSQGVEFYKLGLESRWYLSNRKDSITPCKGWYLGFKPMFAHVYTKEWSTIDTDPNTNVVSVHVSPALKTFYLAYLITFGKQWVWKKGVFLNAGIGIGPYQSFMYKSNNSLFYDKSDRFLGFITFDLAVKVGYSF